MDEAPSLLQRALTWLEASPAEIAGLLVLLTGAALATGLLVLDAHQRPQPSPPPSVAGDAGLSGPADVGVDGTAGAPDADGDGSDADAPAAGPVVVHVTGAVARPGVVTLASGGRVADAVAAAGGATGDARFDLVNLARPLQDGEHVHLPREGEEPRPPDTGGAGAGSGSSGGRIDLNTATVEQLQTLPGIGPAKADAIVRHRDEHGPFAVPGDLRDVPGIGEATFQRLADLVAVS